MLFLLGVEFALIGWGLASRPAPVGHVDVEGGAGPSVIAVWPADEEFEVVALTRVDSDGVIDAAAVLESRRGRVVRAGSRLVVFTDAGDTTVREVIRDPADEELRPAFEFDRFTARVEGGSVLAAAASSVRGGASWLVETDPNGRPRVLVNDGASWSILIMPDGVPAQVVGAAVRAGGVDEAVVALRSETGLHVLVVVGDEIRTAGSVDVGPGDTAVELMAGGDGGLTAYTLVNRDGDRVLSRVELDDARSPEVPRHAEAFPFASNARLVGSLVARIDGRVAPRVLVSEEAVFAARPDGSRDEGALAFMAVWTAQSPRFAYPLLLQIALFALIGSFARRPMIRSRPMEGDAAEAPELPSIPPAALWRRLLAALFDVGLSAMTAILIAVSFLDPAASAYIGAAAAGDPAKFAEVGDPILVALVLDVVFLLLMIWFWLLAFTETATGRSPGKALFGLRVVGLDGKSVGMGACLTRSVLMFLDAVLSRGLLGAVMVVFTRRRQRLGDLLAGTMVVEAKRYPA